MLQLTVIIFLSSLIVAYLGRHRKMGFWGLLFGSILLTPLVGLILLLATENVKPST